MEFNEFKEAVTKCVADRLGEDYRSSETRVLKNNGICYTGLSFCKEGELIAPTVYAETFYESYEKGVPLDRIADSMADIFQNNKGTGFDLDLSKITDYRSVKDRIICRLVNFEKNLELIDDAPFVNFCDLCVLFYVSIGSRDGEEGTIRVTDRLLKSWDIPLSELYQTALLNTRARFGVDVMNIRDILTEMLEGKEEEEARALCEEMFSQDPAPMYVMSNHRRFYGASCMLFSDELEKFSRALGRDFYILPSSVHELILIPDYVGSDPETLAEMVREINETEVPPADVLSDHIYRYAGKEGKISFVEAA